MYLGDAHVGEGGDSVSVQRAERYLVEVDEAEFGDAGSRERGGGVGPNAADADDDDKGIAELFEAFGAEEYSVSRELFEYEFVVKVAGLRALCQEEVVFVLLVEFRDVCACGLVVALSAQGRRVRGEPICWEWLLLFQRCFCSLLDPVWTASSAIASRLAGGAGS